MFLEEYKKRFEKELCGAIERFGEKGRLRDACEYALSSGGKRLRPSIVWMTAESLNKQLDVTPSALSVEFFHTASCIIDDLPCMDNDDLRRSLPSLHKAFCETTAVLASYTLVSEGYGAIYQNRNLMKQSLSHCGVADEVALICLQEAARCGGLKGAAQGQFLDRFPPDFSLETAHQVILQKTSSLFEMAFLFGWLFGGGSVTGVTKVCECARHFGAAFQIADDLEDFLQDKAGGLNLQQILGTKKAELFLEKELGLFQEGLKQLGLWSAPFEELCFALQSSGFGSRLLARASC